MTTLTETRPETLEQRREALDEIARALDDIMRKLAEVTPLSGEALRVAMQTLIEAIHDADDLDSGDLMWDQYIPELASGACDDKQQAAWLIACSQVYDAMAVLLRDPVVTP